LWTTQFLATERPTLSSMPSNRIPDDDFYIPESDITTIDGLRCTTALRTVIDLAPELETTELKLIVRDCLDRQLFTPAEAMARVAQPDMLTRPGAELLRQLLSGPCGMA
jgi:hypothetical protein